MSLAHEDTAGDHRGLPEGGGAAGKAEGPFQFQVGDGRGGEARRRGGLEACVRRAIAPAVPVLMPGTRAAADSSAQWFGIEAEFTGLRGAQELSGQRLGDPARSASVRVSPTGFMMPVVRRCRCARATCCARSRGSARARRPDCHGRTRSAAGTRRSPVRCRDAPGHCCLRDSRARAGPGCPATTQANAVRRPPASDCNTSSPSLYGRVSASRQ